MLTSVIDFRRRHVGLMKRTCNTIGYLVEGVTQTEATTLRDPNDGPRGWTVVEVIGHLLDLDRVFRERAALMIAETYPALAVFDHETAAQKYSSALLTEVYAEFYASRVQTREFFKALTEDEWRRDGIHPERGHFTMSDALMQVGHHDITHIEQIAHILTQRD